MALTDLKKNSTRSTNKSISVDDFIADAEHYAMGSTVFTKIEPEPMPLEPTKVGPMKHATFTLSSEAIELLNKLSKDTGMSKSGLIRQFILHFNEKAELTPNVPSVVVKKVE